MLLGLLSIGCRTPEPPAPAVARPCRDCHAEQVAAWEGSHHALAERELGPEDAWARALGAVRVIGVEPLQQGLVAAGEGRVQAHAEAWDPLAQEHFPLHTDGRKEGEWGHWTGRGMTWNSQCAACHNTGVDKGLDGEGYHTSVEAIGVTCVACHGDADVHARGGEPPRNQAMEATCAACHLRRAELGVRFEPGMALLDAYLPTLIDDPVFRADGLGLDEVFEYTNFASSKMHAAGVRCQDCHDPHSGRLRYEGDALCARCHQSLPFPANHPDHADVGCVDCHMPKLQLMQRHGRRDHGFTSPRRGLLPDPCADCHAEHPASAAPEPQDAAFERLRSTGDSAGLVLRPPNRWRRAAILSLLGPGEEPELLHALGSADALLRMAAVGSWDVRSPVGLRPIEPLLADPSRAVRVAAQRTWTRGGGALDRAPDYLRYLDHHADDPISRMERGLLRIRNGDGAGLDDLRWARSHDPGSPGILNGLSIALSRMGRQPEAVRLLRQGAIEHPQDPEILWSLSLGLAGLQQDAAAIEAFSHYLELQPDDPRAWRNLALLYQRTHDPRFAQALQRALALSPEDRELAAWARSLRASP